MVGMARTPSVWAVLCWRVPVRAHTAVFVVLPDYAVLGALRQRRTN